MTPNSTPVISVIVPVYNVAEYVERCLRSIMAQTYKNLDVVVVDDGSTDGSGALCERMAGDDSRIRVFHKENGGLSDARNYGLVRSLGDWISFIDPDDFVSPVFIEALFSAAVGTGSKIAALPGGSSFREGDSVSLAASMEELPEPRVVDVVELQRSMLYQSVATGAPWRLYRRATLGEDPFPKGLYFEDLASTYKFIRAAGDSIALVDSRTLYAYLLRPSGITEQEYQPIKANSSIEVSRQLYRDIREWYPELSSAAASRCFSVNRLVYSQIPLKEKSERDRVWMELVKYRSIVLADSSARKRERVAAAFACAGQSAFSLFCILCRKLGLLR